MTGRPVWLRPALYVLALAALAGGAWWIFASLSNGKVARTEATIATNRGDAAAQSGNDAVETVGRQASSEAVTDDLSRRNADEIRHAEGSDAPVAVDLHGAGLRSLCRRAAYRNSEKCLQQPAPK